MNRKYLLLCTLLLGAGIIINVLAEKKDDVTDQDEKQDYEREAIFAELVNTHKTARAIDVYHLLPDSVQNEAVFRFAYFELLLESGQMETAMTFGQKIEKDFPYTGRVLCAMGVEKIRLGSLKEGKKLLQHAISIDPWYAQTYYELAKVSTDSDRIRSLCSRGLLMSRGNKELSADLIQLLSKTKTSN